MDSRKKITYCITCTCTLSRRNKDVHVVCYIKYIVEGVKIKYMYMYMYIHVVCYIKYIVEGVKIK